MAPGYRRHQRIGDGKLAARRLNAFARLQRAFHAVEIFRLDAVNLGVGAGASQRQGNAADQPAAAARRQHLIQLHAETHRILGNLQAGCALPRNDAGIVEWLDQHRAAFGANLCRDRLAILFLPVIEHDLRTKSAGAFDLGARRVRRHHDQGRHAEQFGRRRHALGMVAGGKRHHAFGAFAFGDYRQPVAGAAEFERAGALQKLQFQEHPPAGERVQLPAFHQRRAHRIGRDPELRRP